ncbi:MAG: hypothetical protein B9S32_06265 [Verrucomicrobia bacterium Tous-C9LFEB]|nr:MAG: hypothetical protein B9S32_06265 [Verrucomicrobia bacterium Tous-C9LFEB]
MINLGNFGLPNEWLWWGVVIYYAIMLWVLFGALCRRNLEPVTKFMWVFVIVSVPFFGMIFYGILSSVDSLDA